MIMKIENHSLISRYHFSRRENADFLEDLPFLLQRLQRPMSHYSILILYYLCNLKAAVGYGLHGETRQTSISPLFTALFILQHPRQSTCRNKQHCVRFMLSFRMPKRGLAADGDPASQRFHPSIRFQVGGGTSATSSAKLVILRKVLAEFLLRDLYVSN